jgi:hypothetical protein
MDGAAGAIPLTGVLLIWKQTAGGPILLFSLLKICNNNNRQQVQMPVIV